MSLEIVEFACIGLSCLSLSKFDVVTLQLSDSYSVDVASLLTVRCHIPSMRF